MKSLVYLTVVLIAFSLSGCHSYEEDQELFEDIAKVQKAEVDALNLESTNAGSNNGSNPH